VAYDAASDRHQGTCDPPPLVAGPFTIDVLDAGGSLVGGQTHEFQITDCPSTYTLDDEDSTCKCKAGTFDQGSACATCPEGTVATEAGAAECDSCPARETSDASRTRCDCESDYYRSDDDECMLCPLSQVSCAWKSTIRDWVLKPGVWRSDDTSSDLRACRFGATSCPGDTSDGASTTQHNCTARGFGDWPYCGCGYVGPTCAVCAPEHFLDWSGDSCVKCGASDGHTPSIVVGCLVVALGGVAVAFVRNANKKQKGWYMRFKEFQRLGRTKSSTLFFLCQIISAFSGISSDTGSKGHPEPAASFAGALGMTNVDFLQFVPMSCVVTGGMDFYWKMCIRTLVPPALISVLWLWPLSCIARRKPHARAVTMASKLTLVGLEIVTPKVATNVMQAFACTEFGGDWYLRSELTIACDGSTRRIKWVVYAGCCAAAYLIGVPLLIFVPMYRRRTEINRVQQALKDNDSQQTDIISARSLARHPSFVERRPSLVVSVDQNLGWIVKKFEKFCPGRWYAGLFLLVLRILMTSVLVLIPKQNMQAAVASIIVMVGACVLQEAQPYRRGSDNQVELLAQYCVFLWCFSVVLRDMGISDPNLLLSMGIFLIVITVSVFVFAFWRVRAELKSLQSEQKGNGGEDDDPASSEIDEAESDAGMVRHDPEQQSPAELKRGGNSPKDASEQTTASNKHGEASSKPKSPWQLLGLCAAESEIELGDSSEDAQGADGTTALLARLAEKDEALREIGEALRARDAALLEKDAEITRLAALAR